jgi:uncharacterized protein YecT (DUF1311 family)
MYYSYIREQATAHYANMKNSFPMKFVLFTLAFFLQMNAFSQNKTPVEVTPGLQKKLMQEIEKEVPALKQRLVKSKENMAVIEFAIDTFRAERLMSKWIDLDYGDFGMRNAGYAAARQYDSLMNKYYKKLSSVLKGDDRKILVQAQKAWLSYRDKETKLVETISKDEYSGGGTMQQLTEASEFLNMIKNRTIVLFEHYIRATQSY